MKKMISCLLAVLLLASCCVCAFADVSVEVGAANDAESKALAENFNDLFAEDEDLQELAGEDGLVLGDVVTIDGDFTEPVKVELELDDPALVAGLVKVVNGKTVTVPATYNAETGKVEVELSEGGDYTIAKKVINYVSVLRTVYDEVMTTVMIDSVEYEEMMLVPREVEDVEEVESTVFVVVPGDKSSMLNKADREEYQAAVEDVTENFATVAAGNEALANAAPADSFFIPEFTAEQAAKLPIRQRMKIADPDIFAGLVVKTADGEIIPVEAAIDADGYLVFNMEVAGTYVIASERG